jgi:SNF2 family DNA or RNA helicase
MYTGSESPTQKETSRKAFVEGDSQVLIISLRSGAGLDGLQGVCKIGVFAELDYSPAVHIQCGGRIHRDGQDEPVILYYLIADSGSDPVISDILGVKRQQLEGINSPRPEFIETLQVEADYIKRLAEDFLLKNGEQLPEAA